MKVDASIHHETLLTAEYENAKKKNHQDYRNYKPLRYLEADLVRKNIKTI
jgi:hypothetical protein